MAYVPSRVIGILRLFATGRAVWTADEMAQALGVSASTAYRYINELASEGFLDPAGRGGYALGPAFIQYDQIMRQNDRLISVAMPHMQAVIREVDPRVDVVLSRLFKNCVLCIHQENGPAPHPPTSYARGAVMPIFRGATSKVILANLADRALKRLYLEKEREIRSVGPDTDWKSFRAELREIRKRGHCVTEAEVAEGRTGIAAPIFRNGEIIASISIVLQHGVYAEVTRNLDLSERLKSCARLICHEVTDANVIGDGDD